MNKEFIVALLQSIGNILGETLLISCCTYVAIKCNSWYVFLVIALVIFLQIVGKICLTIFDNVKASIATQQVVNKDSKKKLEE